MRSEYLMIFIFLAIGIVGGTIYNWPPPPKQAETQQNMTEVSFEPVSRPVQDQDRLQRFVQEGDEYLQVGNAESAVDYYSAARQMSPDNPAILFRLGIAHFAAERFPSARLFFQDSLPYWQHDDAKRIVNTLMLAKTSIATGQHFESIESLSTIYLSSDNVQGISDKLQSEIAYELLVSLQKQAAQAYLFKLDQIDQPEFDYCPDELYDLLTLIDQQYQPEEEVEVDENQDIADQESLIPEVKVGELQVLQKPNTNINSMVVSGHLNSIPVTNLLQKLGERIGLDIVVSNNVKPYITGQITRINTDEISVAVLLDIVLYPLDLTWVQDGEKIEITPVDSFNEAELAKLRADQAIRLGRYVLLKTSDHRCRDSIILANANLLLMRDDFDGASAIYQQLLDGGVIGELNAKIHYNRGLTALTLERFNEAIEELLAAVDQSLNREIQAAAYYHISQLHLLDSNVRPAIVSASRSLSLTKNPTIRGLAAMNLARAYLVNNDPASANRFLFEESESIKQISQDTIAGVFGAYARSLATLRPLAKEKAIESLVIALADIDVSKINNSVDSLILAKAFDKVGLTNQAVAALQVEIPKEKTAWWRQRVFESALLQQTTNSRAAVNLFKQLAKDPSDMIGQRSILLMARHELTVAKKPEACIELCKSLWENSPTDEVKTKALDLMGIAYRELGDVDSSIYCFYGMLPEGPAPTENEGQSQ